MDGDCKSNKINQSINKLNQSISEYIANRPVAAQQVKNIANRPVAAQQVNGWGL